MGWKKAISTRRHLCQQFRQRLPMVRPSLSLNRARPWLRQLRGIVDAHTEPQALQDALLEAYSDLPTAELTEVMALAFELAHLQGRDQVEQEAGRG